MLKKIIKLFVSVGIFTFLLAGSANALESVNVSIAPFPTQISDISVYNYGVEYPVITYKDISYIPMTYSLCKKLDMQAGFDSEKGLFIVKFSESFPTAEVENCFGSTSVVNSPGDVYTAHLPEYPVYLNGIRIDNRAEEYPVLNFRGITYFPLTYRFCEYDLSLRAEFSSEKGLAVSKRIEKEYKGEEHSRAYVGNILEYPVSSGNLEIDVQKVGFGYTPYTNSDGTYQTYRYFWWDIYSIENSENGDSIEKIRTYSSHNERMESGISWYSDGEKEKSDKFTGENAEIYYDGIEIADLSNHYPLIDFEGYEYTTDSGIVFLRLDVKLNDNPNRAPFDPMHEEYVYVKEQNSITRLEAWDKYGFFRDVASDGCGGYFLYTDGYYPGGYSRYCVPYYSVYRYTADGEFYEIKIPDTNDVEFIGVHGTKLYVTAKYYSNNRSLQGSDISTVNSGYYEIDTVSGEVKMLCPYFVGRPFLTSKGVLYCAAEYAAFPKVINLMTLQVLQIT